MTGRLAGKTALITGGSSGIGLAVAKAFAREGAKLVLFSLDDDKLEQAEAAIDGDVRVFGGDVRSYPDNAGAVAFAEEAFGGLDIFVGNAGIWDWNTRLVDLDPETLEAGFDEVFDINVKGYVLGARASAKALARRKGTMIFTLSVASTQAAGGGVLYTASKHAGLGIVRQLAYELAPQVRVNGVAVSGALTDLRGAASLGLADKSIQELPLREGAPMFLPMGVQPEVEAFAPPYVLLAAADEAQTLTGSVIDALCGYPVRGAVSPNGWSDFNPH